MRRLVIAGNWKMYKNNKEAVETLTQLKDLTKEIKNVDIVIGAPFIVFQMQLRLLKEVM